MVMKDRPDVPNVLHFFEEDRERKASQGCSPHVIGMEREASRKLVDQGNDTIDFGRERIAQAWAGTLIPVARI
jgi:hypothetical protein